MHKKLVSLLMFFLGFMSFMAQAQPGDQRVEMADRMRADGKIYVVVAVVLVILAGLIIYVARLDRKITRLEKGAGKNS
jgi:hypothetical protein